MLFDAKILRFAGVGFVSTLWYVFVVSSLVEYTVIRPVLASFIGFLLSLPLSYMGQKRLTFRSGGYHRDELPRFLLVCIVVFVGTTGSMLVTEFLNLSYWLAISFAVVFIPAFSFVIQNLWVFQQQ